MEFRCYPSDSGLGLNALNVALAPPPPSAGPNFRVYSAGGHDNLGIPQPVLPDSADIPQGGLDAVGQPTPPGDNLFYVGQLDTVVRLSRVHSVWLDSGLEGSTQWRTPVIESEEPSGTDVRVEFRSAVGFSATGALDTPFIATAMDAYGNQPDTPSELSGWSSDISLANGKRYVQARVTFQNNPATGTSPTLFALGLPFIKQ
jgi:hypothetical protein